MIEWGMRLRVIWSVGLVVAGLGVAGCGSEMPGGLGVDARRGPDGAIGDPPVFASCVGRAYTLLPAQPWRHDIATPIIIAALALVLTCLGALVP